VNNYYKFDGINITMQAIAEQCISRVGTDRYNRSTAQWCTMSSGMFSLSTSFIGVLPPSFLFQTTWNSLSPIWNTTSK